MASSHDADTAGITRRKSLAAIAGAGALGLAGCTQSGGSDGGSSLSGPINIAGSSTVFPLMSAVMEDFAEEYPEIDPDISSTGSGGGFSNFFCTGDTDFNNASRPIQPEEEELCAENGVEYVELIAATDALTVVVNPDADWIDSLTTDELAQIWRADPVQTWDEVRDEFPNEEINRFGAADTSGTYDYFIEAILGEEGHTSDYQATEQDNSIANGVAGDEYAIGYFGFAYYFQNPDQLKALGIDDGDGPVEPSLETASSGEYTPLSRPLFTYPSIESLGEEHIAEFARYFVEQTTNEDLVAGDVGYVPATEETQEEQMGKLEDAIEQAQE
ncbi:PstS family phosphate ABC transporter substrate-binding protein [Halorubrum sp. Atlit-26R]|uniref:PstS family phosphate ABC transporter substrate-binding protein n=1 Tax=Halorubrum sp. Atlit-26R TaxID=2282128 RepID=UPI000EF1C817|nr:PstS family phosphate ABC transporter substrate-binding protein [Halorubrum sp. Atlit-26R]RLM76532.1 phosphate ABC transporter substrate-binding protein PstS family protein [Halorubrum sp. Atlit-26R]